ncbi:MAG TPA: proline--tRNA ligase [Candidatus Latescibacteria bacterium]|nr:proline--tRNA ligase [Candidatus Latescibacterota bacterium]
MRLSKAFIPTQKETPAEAEILSHRLMLRAGMIKPHAAGIYSYLPLGWRTLRKIEGIIREEMDRIGGQEFLLPVLSKRDIWEKTGRWQQAGELMFRLKDRKGADLCLAPTHEEIFAAIAAGQIRSYRDMPQIWYQIQTKFRDEPRPRSGLLRGRQFLMKDSYSFDVDVGGLDQSYRLHREVYQRILKRCGLDFFTVRASSGIMGGSESEEFMVLSSAGEDKAVLCKSCGYAANLEVSTSKAPAYPCETEEVKKVYTPGKKTIEEVSGYLHVPPQRLMKSLLMISQKGPVMVLIRGDHQLNETKAQQVFGCEFRPAEPEEVLKLTGAQAGFIGPVGLEGIEIIADLALKGARGLITGANEDDHHLTGLEPGRDFKVDRYTDLRTVLPGDLCPECTSPLDISSAIEVGHIFKLGTKYSEALGATFLDADGEHRPIIMGSYGIGLERIMVSAIEQHADKDGIVWPITIAPYQVHILPLNFEHEEVRRLSERYYDVLIGRRFEVLMDDRNLRAGTKFKDADLIGIPVRVTIGERTLKEGKIEIRLRKTGKVYKVDKNDAADKIAAVVERLSAEMH